MLPSKIPAIGALRDLPLHPLLFGLYPGIAFLAANVGQVQLADGSRLLVGALVASVLTFLVMFLLTRSLGSGAVLATGILLLAMSYGHLYDGLKIIGIPPNLVRHRYLAPGILACLIVFTLSLRNRHIPSGTTLVLNAAGILAVMIPMARLGVAQVESYRARREAAEPIQCSLSPDAVEPLPDVYLIIMDAYERDDVLLEMHGYDNTPFLTALEDRGFYVARGSLSNYRHTELSIASVLNMDYIHDLDSPGSAKPSRWNIVLSIRDSRLRRELECLGYATVSMETGAFWTEWNDAAYFFGRGAGPLQSLRLVGGTSRLEAEFLETTLLRVGFDGSRILARSAGKARTDAADDARDRILYEFSRLEQVPALPSPKLVFVHVLSPHPPFLFGPNGEPIQEADFETGRTEAVVEARLLQAYSDQVTFLNQRILDAVDVLLAESKTSPIIVIMGDHGWADRGPEDKLSILNAYHLPGDTPPDLWPTITPVNSFRAILDAYFGGKFGVLPDRSFFSLDDGGLLDFQEIANSWRLQE